ncbi:MAG: hypothetical protein ACNI25_04715 [Halarcobacter sp.]
MLNHQESVKHTECTVEELYDNSLDGVFAYLPHYFSDEDIRAKDIDYRIFQDNELKKLIHYLRIGDIEKANEINFLQHTPDL